MACKQVLWILSHKEKFRKVLSVPGYIHVPEAQAEMVAAIIPEVLAANPGLKSINWVKPPKKAAPGQPGTSPFLPSLPAKPPTPLPAWEPLDPTPSLTWTVEPFSSAAGP